MKNYIWIIITGGATFLLMFYVKMNTVTFLLILVPLLIIFFTFGSFTYSFRSSLKTEPIPQDGYSDRVEKLNREKFELNKLGFNKIGEMYLKTIPDSVTYIYKHEVENVFFCMYHFGPKTAYDLISHFERGVTLTTSSTVEGGMPPRPAKNLLQIFERTTYTRCLDKHLMSQKLILSNGIKLIDINNDSYISLILKSVMELADYVRKIPFWPVLLIYWTITKRGKIYLSSIEEQIKEGKIRLIR